MFSTPPPKKKVKNRFPSPLGRKTWTNYYNSKTWMIRSFPYLTIHYQLRVTLAPREVAKKKSPIAHPSNPKKDPFLRVLRTNIKAKAVCATLELAGSYQVINLGERLRLKLTGNSYQTCIYIVCMLASWETHASKKSSTNLKKTWSCSDPTVWYTYYIRSKCIKCNTSPIGWFPGEIPGVHCTGSTIWLPPLEKPYRTFLTYISKEQTNTGKTKWRHQSVSMEMCFEWCVISSFNPPTLENFYIFVPFSCLFLKLHLFDKWQ